MNKKERAKLRNQKIGFVFQSYNLLSRLNAFENVELPLLYNMSVSIADRKERTVNALKMVGLGQRMTHKPNELSGGQQQRVAIARALVNEPVMLLADEPTGNLDSRTSYEILTLFQELHGKGRTILFVTHNPEITRFSQRTIMLSDGMVTGDTKNEHIRSAKEVLKALPPPENQKKAADADIDTQAT